MAKPGEVVISVATKRLGGGLFDYADLGGLTLKGFAAPVPAWRVLGRSATESRFEARQDAELTPLIGRQAEFAALLDCWDKARAGSGQIALLSGEAGIGKSRLTAMLLERLASEPHIQLRYFCSQQQQASPLAPCIRQLERVCGWGRDDPPARKWAMLETALVRDRQHGETVALIADLLSLPPDERYPRPDLSAPRRRERTLEVLLRQLELRSRATPGVVVFEDVHWIDPTSLELLERAVQRVAEWPVLLVIIFRPDFPARWSDRANVTSLKLSPLTREQAMEVVENVARQGELPAEVVRHIVARADGVPLFLEEVTKSILEAGRHKTDAGVAAPDLVVPTTLNASLMARLDRLGPAKQVAQMGAAIGRTFSYDLLKAVAGRDGQELDSALDRLVSAGLVFRQADAPAAQFLFKHALVQDAAYSTLLRTTRRDLHRRILDAMTRLGPETVDSPAELLAHHATEAGLAEQATEYWLAAGELSLAGSALVEAMEHLNKGLAVLATARDGAWRDRRELEIQIALGKALIATKGHAAVATGEAFARARDLCDRLGHPPHIVSVLHGQWQHALLRAELASARRRASELLDLGETRNDAVLKVMGCRASGVTCFPLGEFHGACDYLNRGLDLFDPDQRALFAGLTVDDGQVVMQYYSSWALLYLGDLDQARQRCDAALAEARQLGQAFTLAHVLIASVLIKLLLHEFEAAQRPLAEVLALAEEHGISYFRVVGGIFQGRCLTGLGREEEAIAVLKQCLALYRGSGSLLYLPTFLTFLAEAHLAAKQPEEALKLLSEAAAIVAATQTRCDEADLHRVHGELLMMTGDVSSAESWFRQSVAVARRQDAKFLELRGALSLARLWGDQGRRAEACQLLRPIYEWFTEGADTVLLKDTKMLIDALA
ncbi:MAG: ATP-binding protein [Stellaceae bacterium]